MVKEKQEDKVESYRERNLVITIPKEQAHLFGAFEQDTLLTNREKATAIRDKFGIVLIRKKSVSQLRNKLIEKIKKLNVKDSEGKTDYETWTMYKLKSAFVQTQLDV